MFRASPGAIESASACRPTFWSPYVTLFTALAGNLNRQHASRATGLAAATIGTVALIAWWSGQPTVPSSWGSGIGTTKPTTALCVAALGLALVHPGKSWRLAFAVGLAV